MTRDSVTASTKKEAVTSHPFGDTILEGAIDKYGRSRIHQNIMKAVALTDHEAGIISYLSSTSIFSKTYLEFFVDYKIIGLAISFTPNTSHLLIPFIVMNLVNRVISTIRMKGVKMIQPPLYLYFHGDNKPIG